MTPYVYRKAVSMQALALGMGYETKCEDGTRSFHRLKSQQDREPWREPEPMLVENRLTRNGSNQPVTDMTAVVEDLDPARLRVKAVPVDRKSNALEDVVAVSVTADDPYLIRRAMYHCSMLLVLRRWSFRPPMLDNQDDGGDCSRIREHISYTATARRKLMEWASRAGILTTPGLYEVPTKGRPVLLRGQKHVWVQVALEIPDDCDNAKIQVLSDKNHPAVQSAMKLGANCALGATASRALACGEPVGVYNRLCCIFTDSDADIKLLDSVYTFSLGGGEYLNIDALPMGNVLAMINDPRGVSEPSKAVANCGFMQVARVRKVHGRHVVDPFVLYVATCNVAEDEPLYVDYGAAYWKNHKNDIKLREKAFAAAFSADNGDLKREMLSAPVDPIDLQEILEHGNRANSGVNDMPCVDDKRQRRQ